MLRKLFASRSYSHYSVVAAIFLALGALAPAANAQQPTADQFLANPQQVLAQFPNGGPQLVSLIRDVATSNPDALASIISLLASSDSAQASAIGSGLGQAAQLAMQSNNPSLASQIQTGLAAAGNQNANAAYASTTGNTVTASVGGGGGGGVGGPVGGGPPGGGGGGGGNTGGGGGGGSQTYQNAGLTGGTGGLSSTGQSVSPH